MMLSGKQLAWSLSAAAVALVVLLAVLPFGGSPGNETGRPADVAEAPVVDTSAGSGANLPAARRVASSHVKESFKERAEKLLALAADGDVEAAKIVFQDTSQCKYAASVASTTAAMLNVCAHEDRPMFIERCQGEADKLQARLEIAKSQASACSGLSDADELRLRYQATERAAKLGDQDAQACMIEGNFDQSTMPLTDPEREQYQADALFYYKSALERGDWRVVKFMSWQRHNLGHLHGLQYLLTEGDNQTAFRMVRLLRMGAVGDYAKRLDQKLALSNVASDPEGDAWAQDTFDKYFSKSGNLSDDPVVCGSSLQANP